jgi:hypothetical protein
LNLPLEPLSHRYRLPRKQSYKHILLLQELSVGLEFLGFHQSEEDDFLNDDGKV